MRSRLSSYSISCHIKKAVVGVTQLIAVLPGGSRKLYISAMKVIEL